MAVRFVFPRAEDFRESRPEVCWEHMYGWIDGYGVFFDPAVLTVLGELPTWENGYAGGAGAEDFLIAPCARAGEEIGEAPGAGIYVRPHWAAASRREVVSEKEALALGDWQLYYPFGLPYDRYEQGPQGWRLGERPAITVESGRVAVCFEAFSMLWRLNADWPHQRFHHGADMVLGLLAAVGRGQGPVRTSSDQSELRLDFQAYGVNRLLIQWFLERQGADPAAVAAADAALTDALAAWQQDDAASARASLGRAFTALAELRAAHSQLDMVFLEVPHMGLLLADKGFFELEWPQQSRQTLYSYLDHVNDHGYQVSIEAGGGDWRHLADRYPELAAALRAGVEAGDIELTNGTLTLPYALLSPMAWQYWQLALGRQAHEETFGQAPTTYQAQENSLSPQMPELLRHFGYDQAMHISQNHGTGPSEDGEWLHWRSPAGIGIPAVGVRRGELGRMGVNYYLDLPLMHSEFGRRPDAMNYVNFQDLGYVPLRVQMIRAHHYAPVWGRYTTPARQFAAAFPEDAPARCHGADDYNLSANVFYRNYTNANALSQYERVFTQAWRERQAEFTALAVDDWPRVAALRAARAETLMLEAHDTTIVQGQRRGEFHANKTLDPPPYARETLGEEAARVAARAEALADAALPPPGDRFYNAAEVTLPFARVRQADREADAWGHVLGPFAPWQACAAGDLEHDWQQGEGQPSCGDWRLGAAEGFVQLAHPAVGDLFLQAIDRRHGALVVAGGAAESAGNMLRATFHFRTPGDVAQQLFLSVLLAAEGGLAELMISYGPRQDFDHGNRWDDFLGLRIGRQEPFGPTWRFNPNVWAETRETRVASPNVISLGHPHRPGRLALFNEGSGLYERDEDGSAVNWVIHVADETGWVRRGALYVGPEEPFQMARAWHQGVVPVAAAKPFLPEPEEGWGGISVETVIAPGRFLISNLHNEPRTLTFSTPVQVRDMTGQSLTVPLDGACRATLAPAQLATLIQG